jgi:hypothetical protein
MFLKQVTIKFTEETWIRIWNLKKNADPQRCLVEYNGISYTLTSDHIPESLAQQVDMKPGSRISIVGYKKKGNKRAGTKRIIQILTISQRVLPSRLTMLLIVSPRFPSPLHRKKLITGLSSFYLDILMHCTYSQAFYTVLYSSRKTKPHKRNSIFFTRN